MSWLLVVPKHGAQDPYLVDSSNGEAMAILAQDQQTRAPNMAELYDVSPGAITPARLTARTVYEVEVADMEQKWAGPELIETSYSFEHDDLGSAALPDLPQRRPRREELLEGGARVASEFLSGDDTPPEYDPETGERIRREDPLPVGDWQPGPFVRRSD